MLFKRTNRGEAERFVCALYRGVLRREPDQDGLSQYVDAMLNGLSPAAVAEAFASSEEFRALPTVGVVAPGKFCPETAAAELSEAETALVDRFHDFYYGTWREDHPRLNIAWLGYRAQKCPNDLWTYQELIAELRPDAIIETGTRFGGSALFLATVCDLLGHGEVVTIDIADPGGRPDHPRITFLRGSSTDPEIVAQVRRRVPPPGNALVLLDSDHSREHVHQELRIYREFVPIGGYLVVEDTNVNGHPTYPDHGPGPMEGLEDFLAETGDFVPDRGRERFLMTCNPKGFLRRVA